MTDWYVWAFLGAMCVASIIEAVIKHRNGWLDDVEAQAAQVVSESHPHKTDVQSQAQQGVAES